MNKAVDYLGRYATSQHRLRDVLGTDDELFIDFISKMLTLDMHARVSAAEALMHPWFTLSLIHI